MPVPVTMNPFKFLCGIDEGGISSMFAAVAAGSFHGGVGGAGERMRSKITTVSSGSSGFVNVITVFAGIIVVRSLLSGICVFHTNMDQPT